MCRPTDAHAAAHVHLARTNNVDVAPGRGRRGDGVSKALQGRGLRRQRIRGFESLQDLDVRWVQRRLCVPCWSASGLGCQTIVEQTGGMGVS